MTKMELSCPVPTELTLRAKEGVYAVLVGKMPVPVAIDFVQDTGCSRRDAILVLAVAGVTYPGNVKDLYSLLAKELRADTEGMSEPLHVGLDPQGIHAETELLLHLLPPQYPNHIKGRRGSALRVVALILCCCVQDAQQRARNIRWRSRGDRGPASQWVIDCDTFSDRACAVCAALKTSSHSDTGIV